MQPVCMGSCNRNIFACLLEIQMVVAGTIAKVDALEEVANAFLSFASTEQGSKSMDVDLASVIPGTPNADDYASLGDSDDLSRRTTPAFFENEHVELKNGRDSSNEGREQLQHGGSNGAAAGFSAPDITYEMDLDNSEDEEQLEVQQVTLQARRTVSAER